MASALDEVKAILGGKAIVDDKIYLNSGGLYTIMLGGPNIVPVWMVWWDEVRDWLTYLSNSNSPAYEEYTAPTSVRVVSWLGVLAVFGGGFYWIKKRKQRKGRKHG